MNTRFLFIYIIIYIITIWDSYRQCIDLNKIYLLAEHENAPIVPFKMTGYALNFLDIRNPVLAFIQSLLFPGLGHLYIHRLLEGFLYLSGTIFLIYKSRLFEAAHLSLHDGFSNAINLLDPQWTLFLPSIYCFVAYEAYVLCVECNKTFKREQRQFLEKNYQQTSNTFFHIKRE